MVHCAKVKLVIWRQFPVSCAGVTLFPSFSSWFSDFVPWDTERADLGSTRAFPRSVNTKGSVESESVAGPTLKRLFSVCDEVNQDADSLGYQEAKLGRKFIRSGC